VASPSSGKKVYFDVAFAAAAFVFPSFLRNHRQSLLKSNNYIIWLAIINIAVIVDKQIRIITYG
jgi:hypothetical protein